MRKLALLFSLCLASLLAPLAATAHEEKKANPEPKVPLSFGYESALAAHANKPIIRPRGTAPALLGPGDVLSLLLTGKESGNALMQLEATVAVGGGPPAHVHIREDETFYVVSGNLEILVGEKIYNAKAGDFVYIPKGTIHRFKNVGGAPSVQLVTITPTGATGLEGFFQEVYPPAQDPKATPPPLTEEMIRKISKAAPKYGLILIPPSDSGKR